MFLQPDDQVLFQGDSITDAFRKPEEVGTSYRMGAGWTMMVAAKYTAEHPDLRLRFENRGVAGNALLDMAGRWDRDCLDLRPTVLNVLVGVNDTIRAHAWGQDRPLADFEADYRRLLQRTRQALPATRIILCEPFLLPAGDVTAAWLAHLRPRQAVVRTLAAEFHTVFVPLQEAFDAAAARTGPAYWLFDGIHPHAAGQWLLMQEWLRSTG